MLVFALINTAVVFTLLELTLRVIQLRSRTFENEVVANIADLMNPPFSWERRFLENYSRGELVYQGLHVPHDTRGWTLKPNLSAEKLGYRYTTNSQGFRSLHEYVDDADKFEILIVGDSFTFGTDVNDGETWPHMMQQVDERLNVFNLGIGGYGVDQMYITLREEISQYEPQVVVAAIIYDDLPRATLDFRDFKKPKFRLHNEGLVLTNTPIGSVEDVCIELEDKDLDDHSVFRTVNVFNALREGPRGTTRNPICDPECQALNSELIESMARLAEESQAEFLLVYLPAGLELKSAAGPEPCEGEIFFEEYMKTHHHPFLNTRPNLRAASFEKSDGHYKRPENEVVSRLVYEKIREMPSWQTFLNNNPEQESEAFAPQQHVDSHVKYLSVEDAELIRQGWGAASDNSNAAGGWLSIGGRSFTRGIGTHAASEIAFPLRGGWRSLRASVGIDDSGNCSLGSVQFKVLLDEDPAFESGIMRPGQVQEVDVEIGDARTLTLVVSDGGDGITCDAADWVEVRLVR